ncbi:MAG: hypothetical protein JWM44_1538 [Bacilli bacterium]|nr:hypothetical protein [Bacilli bacterium]
MGMKRTFNLSLYLKTFFRQDLLDEYEAKCLEIVDKYKDQDTIEVIETMFNEFNKALSDMGNKAVEEKRRRRCEQEEKLNHE